MPIPTPFHSRTAPLCVSHQWRDWGGCLAAVTYEHSHEREYYAIRNAAALIDVSPLFKYEIQGPDACRLLDRVVTRDVSRCPVGKVIYTPWCDDRGKVAEDGTLQRLGPDRFRLTCAERNLLWLQDCGWGLRAEVVDLSRDLAALALQGPLSRRLLEAVCREPELRQLPYFGLAQCRLQGIEAIVTRTGFTGDLGYELWVEADQAESLWDVLFDRGSEFGVQPAGLAALDIARIEAGLLLIGVDYISSRQALVESQESSPFELGLGWAVARSKRSACIGGRALQRERRLGSRWSWAGLAIDWDQLEEQYRRFDLPPQVAGQASREAVPILLGESQIGYATSRVFSPILKKYIAMGQIESRHCRRGASVEVELPIEYSRRRVSAKIVALPFFNPPRKRS